MLATPTPVLGTYGASLRRGVVEQIEFVGEKAETSGSGRILSADNNGDKTDEIWLTYACGLSWCAFRLHGAVWERKRPVLHGLPLSSGDLSL
jgi:hypothetical protein